MEKMFIPKRSRLHERRVLALTGGRDVRVFWKQSKYISGARETFLVPVYFLIPIYHKLGNRYLPGKFRISIVLTTLAMIVIIMRIVRT